MKTLLKLITLSFVILVCINAPANSNNAQLSCLRYPATETNGYPRLNLVTTKNELLLLATNESGVGSYFYPFNIQTDHSNYILTFNNSESKKCDDFTKCYDKILLYLSKNDDDGFIKNATYKTSQAMMDGENRKESLQYICRHKNLETGFLKYSTLPLSADSCKVPPQADCGTSPKRLCCDCTSGALECY